MNNLQALYQDVIVDHGCQPRNFRVNTQANCIKEGDNPLCGDYLTLYVTEEASVIKEACFHGQGCAISMASASLLTECIVGKTIEEVSELFGAFHALVTNKGMSSVESKLGKLQVMGGVCQYPARVKCATLAWHALMGALQHTQGAISTE